MVCETRLAREQRGLTARLGAWVGGRIHDARFKYVQRGTRPSRPRHEAGTPVTPPPPPSPFVLIGHAASLTPY
jgi:hypothetical protein